jgi:hypothetical protein
MAFGAVPGFIAGALALLGWKLFGPFERGGHLYAEGMFAVLGICGAIGVMLGTAARLMMRQ